MILCNNFFCSEASGLSFFLFFFVEKIDFGSLSNARVFDGFQSRFSRHPSPAIKKSYSTSSSRLFNKDFPPRNFKLDYLESEGSYTKILLQIFNLLLIVTLPRRTPCIPSPGRVN